MHFVLVTRGATPQVETEGMSKAESTTMLCESGATVAGEPGPLTVLDLELICDLFYLPCEHGPKVSGFNEFLSSPFPPQSLDVLSEFYWLKTHAGCMLKGCQDADPSTEVYRTTVCAC